MSVVKRLVQRAIALAAEAEELGLPATTEPTVTSAPSTLTPT